MTTLLHIGYHKTGTTWLQHAVFPEFTDYRLVTHRHDLGGVLLRYLREEDDGRYPQSTVAAYFNELADAGNLLISSEDLSGNQTEPVHAERTTDRLAALFPSAKVLVVVRRQDQMARSLFVESLKRGVPLDQSQFLTGDPAEGALDPVKLHYEVLIGRYRKHFGADRVLVLPFELLADDADRFLGEMAAFAETTASTPPAGSERVNASPSGWRVQALLELNRVAASPRLERLGLPLWRSGVATTRRRLARGGTRTRSGSTRGADGFEAVLTPHRPHNVALQEYCDHDLRSWGYY